MLPSEVPRLATDSPVRVFLVELLFQVPWKLVSFLRLPSRDGSLFLPLLSLFYLLYIFLPPFKDNGPLFWVPNVLCQLSEVVLWNLLSVQMFFWWICGGENGLPILFLHHLRTAPSIISSNKCSGLISFRIDWLDLLAVQRTLKNLLQHHSSKASILRHSAFFMVPSTCECRECKRLRLDCRSGRSPGLENGTPLKYFCLEISMGRKAWRATVHRASKSGTWLSTHMH